MRSKAGKSEAAAAASWRIEEEAEEGAEETEETNETEETEEPFALEEDFRCTGRSGSRFA